MKLLKTILSWFLALFSKKKELESITGSSTLAPHEGEARKPVTIVTPQKEEFPTILKTAELVSGEPKGNPGYSFAAARYNQKTKSYEPGGVVWVGKKGGDTAENRELFRQWLRDVSIVNVGRIRWKEPLK